MHVDQMHQHNDNINTNLKDTKGQLDKLYDEITRTLEKIASREKYVNNQLEHHLQVLKLQYPTLACLDLVRLRLLCLISRRNPSNSYRFVGHLFKILRSLLYIDMY